MLTFEVSPAASSRSSAVLAEHFEGCLELAHQCRHVCQYGVLVGEPIVQLRFQVCQESIGRASGVRLKVVEELVRQVRVLRQLVVQILHPLLPHLVLLLDIVLHVVRLVFDFLDHLLLLGNTQLLFLDQAVLYSLQLAADRVQVVVVVLDTVLAFLIDPALGLVHSGVVCLPLLTEYLCFFIHLTLQVVA